jgi:hypothetical protein
LPTTETQSDVLYLIEARFQRAWRRVVAACLEYVLANRLAPHEITQEAGMRDRALTQMAGRDATIDREQEIAKAIDATTPQA